VFGANKTSRGCEWNGKIDVGKLGLVYTMEDGLFSWFDVMVQLPWPDFLTKSIYKAFGLFTRCKPNVDQEDDHAPKSECADFLKR
jgi:hypothetical protein